MRHVLAKRSYKSSKARRKSLRSVQNRLGYLQDLIKLPLLTRSGLKTYISNVHQRRGEHLGIRVYLGGRRKVPLTFLTSTMSKPALARLSLGALSRSSLGAASQNEVR